MIKKTKLNVNEITRVVGGTPQIHLYSNTPEETGTFVIVLDDNEGNIILNYNGHQFFAAAHAAASMFLNLPNNSSHSTRSLIIADILNYAFQNGVEVLTDVVIQ